MNERQVHEELETSDAAGSRDGDADNSQRHDEERTREGESAQVRQHQAPELSGDHQPDGDRKQSRLGDSRSAVQSTESVRKVEYHAPDRAGNPAVPPTAAQKKHQHPDAEADSRQNHNRVMAHGKEYLHAPL